MICTDPSPNSSDLRRIPLVPATTSRLPPRLTLSRTFTHGNAVYWVSFLPDGRRVASASLDNTVKIRDAADGTHVGTLAGHGDGVTYVDFLEDGRIISASLDKSLRFWSPDGTLISTLGGHADYLSCAAVSSETTWIASGGFDKTVRLWDAASVSAAAVLTGHTEPVQTVAFSGDGTLLASGGNDLSIRLWDLTTRTLRLAFPAHSATVEALAFVPGTGQLASGSSHGRIRLWEANGSALADLDGRSPRIKSLTFSRDGHWLVTGGSDGMVRFRDIRDRQELTSVRAHQNTVYGLAFSPDGQFLATAGFDRTIHVWSISPTG